MDFEVGLRRTQKQHDSVWVVVDRLTNSSCFIPIKSTYLVEDYAKILKDEIVYRYGIRYPSYRIGVHNSHLGFGVDSKKVWVLR